MSLQQGSAGDEFVHQGGTWQCLRTQLSLFREQGAPGIREAESKDAAEHQQCTGQPHDGELSRPHMSIVQRLRTPDLGWGGVRELTR